MIDRSLYMFIMKQLAEELPDGLDDRADAAQAAEFFRRFEEYIKISYEMQDPESSTVDIYSAMGNIRAVLDDNQWAQLHAVIGDAEIELIRLNMFGKPMLETGRFDGIPESKMPQFHALPRPVIKGVVKGIVETIREHELGVLEAVQGRIDGNVTVDDAFSALLTEVLNDEIDDAVADFRESLMNEVTAAHFVPWGPPTSTRKENPHAPD